MTDADTSKEKFQGPFITSPCSVEDEGFIAYKLANYGGETQIVVLTKGKRNPASGTLFGGNYDVTQFYTRYPDYIPSPEVAASVDAYLKYKSSQKSTHHGSGA